MMAVVVAEYWGRQKESDTSRPFSLSVELGGNGGAAVAHGV
jgi:hypothetical protein